MLFEKKPRIIYNDDSCSLVIMPRPHSTRKISRTVDYLKGSQVDVLCWCVMEGDVASSYPAQSIENKFQLFFDQFPKTKAGERLCQKALASSRDLTLTLYSKGIDYMPELIGLTRQAGMKFYGSFRMNDAHHKSEPLGRFPQAPEYSCYLASEFWKTHQHCRLWEVTDALSYYNAAMDYSYAEVRNNRINAGQNPLYFFAKPVYIGPALFVGYPLPIFGWISPGHFAVGALCPFDNHPRQTGACVFIEWGVKQFGFFPANAHFDFKPGFSELLDAAAGQFGRVFGGNKDFLYAGINHGLRAGRCFTRMAAWFQRDIHCRPSWIITLVPAVRQGVNFRVRLAKTPVPPLSDNGVIFDDDTSHRRVGLNIPQTPSG